jgi:hypothetical protein
MYKVLGSAECNVMNSIDAWFSLVRLDRLIRLQTDNFSLYDELNGLRKTFSRFPFSFWNSSINIFIHICIYKHTDT